MRELSDKELEKVCGGFTKNPDGTFNLKKYEYISGGSLNYQFVIIEGKLS